MREEESGTTSLHLQMRWMAANQIRTTHKSLLRVQMHPAVAGGMRAFGVTVY